MTCPSGLSNGSCVEMKSNSVDSLFVLESDVCLVPQRCEWLEVSTSITGSYSRNAKIDRPWDGD